VNKIKESWSKRIWYVAALVAMLTIMLGNIVVILVLNLISLVIIAILSISLKRKESNMLIQPSTSPNQTLDVPNQEYITLHGVQYQVRSKSLELKNKAIKDLSEIEGIEKLWYLKKLDLSYNTLTSIEGLEFLINLKVLKLNDNQIQSLANLKPLKNLKKLYLNNNQLKAFNEDYLPDNLEHIDIANNPIEKFNIYTRSTYTVLHIGSKKSYPKQELKRLKQVMKRIKSSQVRIHKVKHKVNFTPVFVIFLIWAIITFLLALVINIPMMVYLTPHLGYWESLFHNAWIFVVTGIGAAFAIYGFYVEFM